MLVPQEYYSRFRSTRLKKIVEYVELLVVGRNSRSPLSLRVFSKPRNESNIMKGLKKKLLEPLSHQRQVKNCNVIPTREFYPCEIPCLSS